MSQWRRVLGVLLVGSAVLVGCGGGDGDEQTSTPARVSGQTSGLYGGGAAGGVTGALDESDCVAVTTSLADLYGGTLQAVANLTEGLRGQLAALEGYAAKAPPEIRADLRLVTEVFAEFIDAQAKINIGAVAAGVDPLPGDVAQLRAVVERLASPEFVAAASRMSTWLEAECGP